MATGGGASAASAVRPAADLPAHAELLRDFANTFDVDASTPEGLVDPSALVRWLREHGLLSNAKQATAQAKEADLSLARDFREALRDEFLAHHDAAGGEQPASPRLQAVTGGLTLRVDFSNGGPRLEPVDGGVPGALARLAAAVVMAHWDGSWERLKVCPADDCLWAFYDTSKNRSRTWCSMRVCGNRTKTRTYRSRHRAQTSNKPSPVT
jgi:predicted RNA-binding Zn ribbon-like protein